MINRRIHFEVTEPEHIKLCDGSYMYQFKVDGVYELPFEIPPTTGEHDFNECKNCQKTIGFLTKWFRDLYKGRKGRSAFPNCCEGHKKLYRAKGFKKSDFDKVPDMVVRKVIYTNQHITNNHNTENWFRSIADYMDLVVESFGQFPNGCGGQLFLPEYFGYMKNLIGSSEEIPEEKKQAIYGHIDDYSKPIPKSEGTELKTLVETYSKWLNEFPFQISSYFGELKEGYEKRVLILNGKPHVNQFTGVGVSKLHTKDSLIEALVKLTKDLLSKINANDLVEKGIIQDVKKHRYELETEHLRIANDELFKEFTTGELEYVTILKRWLELQKSFFRNISDLIVTEVPKEQITKPEQLKSLLAAFGFFELPFLKELTNTGQARLLDLLTAAPLPYKIAMFDFIGFLSHVEKHHVKTKNELHQKVAKMIGSTGRAVKGNINVLNENSKEDRSKYTAHLHKDKVKTDYQNLK